MKTQAKQKTGKRILSVTIKRVIDDSPDTSFLGEYSNRATSQFSIDRAHSEDCQSIESNHRQAVDQLERVIYHLNEWRTIAANDSENTEWEALDDALDTCAGLQNDVAECDCGERGDMARNEYRYFNPSSNYVTADDKPQNLTPDEVIKYTRQDYERMESLNAGHWSYIGIRAEAKILIGDVARYPNFASGTIQTIGSGGLYGIESDSERSYFSEVAAEQLAELKNQLRALGFSARAISKAFQSDKVQECDE